MKLITAGEKVGASEATLLTMLKISPFFYGLQIRQGTVKYFGLISQPWSSVANSRDEKTRTIRWKQAKTTKNKRKQK